MHAALSGKIQVAHANALRRLASRQANAEIIAKESPLQAGRLHHKS